MKTRSENYWEKRSMERELLAEKNSLPYLRSIQYNYKQAQRAIINEYKNLYKAYYKKDGGFDILALEKAATKASIEAFRKEMKRAGLDTRLPKQYQGRMSRLELIEAQIWGEIKKASLQEQVLNTQSYRNTLEQTYNNAYYDISKGLGEPFTFSAIPTSRVEKILNTRFAGRNYSERIWRNSNIMARSLQDTLAQAIITGQSQAKTARLIRDRFNVQNYVAARLVRTETNYFQNQAEIECYDELGIEKSKFLAVLDSRTSEVCRDHDGDIFETKKAKQGINAPPLHVNCRSTLVPYFGEEFEPKKRLARDPETGKNYQIDNMTYREWEKTIGNPENFEDNSIVSYKNSTNRKVDEKLVSKNMRQLDLLLEQFPSVKNSLDSKGGIKVEMRQDMRGKAATNTKTSDIRLNSRAYSSASEYRKILKREIETKNKMRVPEKYYDIYSITHEFGHIIENYILGKDSYNKDKLLTERQNIIIIAKRIGKMNEEQVLKNMSSYGNSKPQEFFAEAFTSYRLGGSSLWVKTMSEYLRKKGVK